MKRISKIILIILLLLASTVQPLWCRGNEYKQDLLHLKAMADASNRYEKGFLFAEQAYAYALKYLGPEHLATLTSMNNLAKLYQDQGWHSKAESLYRKILQCRKKMLGPKHPYTLISINNLAESYRSQGKYSEAKSLSKEYLQIRKKVMKRNYTKPPVFVNNLKQEQNRHVEIEQGYKKVLQVRKKNPSQKYPSALNSINSLAFQYKEQGRYSEAEPLFKKALQIREKMLGREDTDTLTSINNLALLYQDQGRYFEAKPFFEEVVRLRKKVLGWEHPDTLSSMNSLATLYVVMGRDGEAGYGMKDIYGILENSGAFEKVKAVYEETLQERKKELGQEYIDKLTSVNDFDVLDSLKSGFRDFDAHWTQDFYKKAQELYERVLQDRKEVLGREHPETLTSMNDFAALYCAQGLYSKAESLNKEALMLRKKVLGREHPDTFISMNDLAALYWEQGRYSEAERLFKKVLRLREKVLGREHPDTLDTLKNYIALLISSNKPAKALVQLKRLEDQLATRSFQELYAASSYKVRLQYLHTISYFRDMAFSLAAQQSGEEYQRFAANTILRWKQIYSEENSRQHRQLGFNQNQEVTRLKAEINQVRAELSQSWRIKNNEEIAGQIGQLNENEKNLALLLRASRSNLAVKKINFEQIASKIPSGSCLVDYCLFRRLDFKSRKTGEQHLAALILFPGAESTEQFIFQDLGPMSAIFVKDFVLRDNGVIFRYDRLLGLFDDRIKDLKHLYIAPDYWLNICSFASLTLPDGRFLVQRQQINRLQTGRDLLEKKSNVPRGKGLVVLGGAKYGESKTAAAQQSTARQFKDGFAYLRESRREAEEIFDNHKNSAGGTLFTGEDASEYSLKQLKQPPRILHLATHGFSLWGDGDKEKELADKAPLLLSGLALAGANNGLQGKLDKHGDDGLLYSLEVLDLNLQGTELVSLSACETGQGVMDYSEGVYGLVRAFRTAGAKNVLMTLISVKDQASREFMETFYNYYLSKNLSPSEALHQTRLDFIHHQNRAYRDYKVWAPYVMVGL